MTTKFADATKKPLRDVTVRVTHFPSPFVVNAYPRSNGLTLVLSTHNPAPGSFLLSGGKAEVEDCSAFSELLTLTGLGSPYNRLAVTEDAVWFREPFGYLPWKDLEELVREAAKQKGLRSEK